MFQKFGKYFSEKVGKFERKFGRKFALENFEKL